MNGIKKTAFLNVPTKHLESHRERERERERALIAFSKYPELVCSIANVAVVSQSKEFDVVSFITVKRLPNLL